MVDSRPLGLPQDLSEDLEDATNRLVRTVDAIEDQDYAAPSGLPGWTRAHVVAHLALNAEGLAAALTGIVGGDDVPMYASQEARDADIEELAGAEPSTLRSRLMAAGTNFGEAVGAVPDDGWDVRIERAPGDRTFAAGAAIGMREREVEIHHADLVLGYRPADWPLAFCRRLLDAMAKREGWVEPFTVHPTDMDGSWQCGSGTGRHCEVRGSAADLAWWLTGRGEGDGLTTDNGELPRIEDW